MKKNFLHSILIIAAFSCVLLFAGCLKLETSFDLTLSQQGEESNSASNSSEPSSLMPEAPSTDEAPSNEPPANEPSETEAPSESTSSPAATSENTEYDILRTGEFSFIGTMTTDGDSMEANISVGKDKIYFTSKMDGFEIGLYVDGKKTYIYAPAHKKYLKMSSVVAKMLQMDPEEFIQMTEDLGFDKLPLLSSAKSVESGYANDIPCDIYTFKYSDNTGMRAYLNGKKLVLLEYVDANGLTTNFITFKSVSSGFPKMPPDGFEEMGYIEFFMLIANEIE